MGEQHSRKKKTVLSAVLISGDITLQELEWSLVWFSCILVEIFTCGGIVLQSIIQPEPSSLSLHFFFFKGLSM